MRRRIVKKILCLGEILIDFTASEKGKALKDVGSFIKNPGGSPPNTAVAISMLGGEVSFISKISNDSFGEFLCNILKKFNINIEGIVRTNAPTCLAFVSIKENGVPDFEFYRENTADTLLEEKDIDEEFLKNHDIFHFGSITLLKDPSRSTALSTFLKAKEYGIFTSVDPNIRPNLIEDKDTFLKDLHLIFKNVDLLKISEEDLEYLYPDIDIHKYCNILINKGAKYIIITRGERGSLFCSKGLRVEIPGFSVDVVDTTGAGDGFMGAILYYLSLYGTEVFTDKEKIAQLLKFANAQAALVCTKKGGIPSMPKLKEVENFLKKYRIIY